MSSFNLTQIVTEPTRTINSSATLIDLVFASSPNQVEFCSTIPPLANTDHSGLHIKISIKSPKRVSKAVHRRIWKYSLADFDAMADFLDEPYHMGHVDSCWANWKNCFLRIMELILNRRLPWINHTIIQAMRKCKVLYKLTSTNSSSKI